MLSRSPLLEVKNYSLSFANSPQKPAVNCIDFTIQTNELVALVGESGSGKSVTALSLLGLLPKKSIGKQSGSLLYTKKDGSQIDLLNCDEAMLESIRGTEIAMVFQEPMSSLNPLITVGEQISEAIRKHKKLKSKAAFSEAVSLLELLKIPNPSETYYKYPHQLSGGQKQRIVIAIAMCCEPRLLICDEPTTALDVTVQASILETLKELQRNTGIGILFITHDLGVVSEIADQTIVLYRGELIEIGPTKQLLQNPQQEYTKALIQCRPQADYKGRLLPTVESILRNDSVHNQVFQSTASTQPFIEIKNLNVRFVTKRNWLGKPKAYYQALKDINLTIYKGETLGIVGESGSGKTTLGKALLQLIPADSGDVLLNGTAIGQFSKLELRKKLQLVFQDPFSSLNPSMTIEQALTEPMKVHGMGNSHQERKSKVIELLEKVQLSKDILQRYPHEFSGGQRQRIVIARALTLNPACMVCDESVAALDVSVQAQVLNLLQELKESFQFTILFITHDLNVVHYISDRILVMNKGSIVETGTAHDVFYHPQMPYTQQLLSAIPRF